MDETLQKLYKVLVHFEEKEVGITEDEEKLNEIKKKIEENLNVSIEETSQMDLIHLLKDHDFTVEFSDEAQKVISVPMDDDTQVKFHTDK
ncbi:hypothetical protein DOS68_09535 [Staphylococcus felis]|uniref:Uncharacterized protein n=1 Tax=Staphylococcus felis TaxID=46127 RepID=A0AAX1RY93_9STAP|nr:hypothetical protein [Staphylococcus felis]AVP36902.1 hypothetical protein C7J90_08020 [Staphylococcus felis]MBH9579873.1 hypothetical protein [Staphylococcus felis]PNZ35233.1 hypothetical protein CD143_07165 [Staphylococcus felis]QQB03142.1 hypothetical protein I6H71_10490 [Staphylococcus felis]REH75783.1 hypothetical protein DOS59_09460 [Staphylococcus felis]